MDANEHICFVELRKEFNNLAKLPFVVFLAWEMIVASLMTINHASNEIYVYYSEAKSELFIILVIAIIILML